jgi:outer membrane protein assembly factor BamB
MSLQQNGMDQVMARWMNQQGISLGGVLRSALLVGLLTVDVSAGDWPAWRGASRDDISTETGLLTSWPEDGPPRVWTTAEAGLGYSGFAIVSDVLYTMGATGKDGDAEEFVVALNAETGHKLWQSKVGANLENDWGGGPRSTPSVSGDRLVAIGGRGDVVCMSIADGTELWRASLTDMGGRIPNWGYCESALIDGDRVIVTPGGDNGTVACLSLADGSKLWQSEGLTAGAHYSSAIVVDHFGRKQYIQRTEQLIFGLDADGKVLWQHDFPGGRVAVIPTPIYSAGQVYVTAGYGAGCLLLNITADNKVEKLYDNKNMKNHHGGVLLLDGHIYGHSDDRGLTCQNLASGEVVWSDEGRNNTKGATAYADGHLYCLNENSGECRLVKATPESYSLISSFRMEPQTTQRSAKGKVWTHPVICNGHLYLRDQEIICCYKITP